MSSPSNSQRALFVILPVITLIVGLVVGAVAMIMLAPAGDSPAGDPAVAGNGGQDNGPPPAAVLVDQALTLDLQQRFEVTGRLRERQRTVIAAQVEGMLIEMPVDAGDAVEADQTILARVEDVFVKIELRSAQAEVVEAEADVDQSRRDLEYITSLAQSDAARPKEVSDAGSALAANLARLEAAIARRDRAAEDLQRVALTAPFDGVVTAKRAEVGQRVMVGDPLVEIISRGQIDAILQVPERIINQITIGTRVELDIVALGRTVTGSVVALNPDGRGAARTFPVKVRLDDQGGMFKPGMSVTARLPLEQVTPRLTVPRDAIQWGAQGVVVWVVQEREQGPPAGMPVPVRVLFGHGDRMAVAPAPGPMAGMLQDNTGVVVQGAERIFFPGHTLNVMNSEQIASPPTEPPSDNHS